MENKLRLIPLLKKVLKKLPNKLKSNLFFLQVYRRLFEAEYAILEEKTIQKLRDIECADSDEVCKIQQTMLFDMLKYAYENTNYYRKLFDDNKVDLTSIESFKKIPILNKNLIKANLDSLLSKKIPLEQLGLRNTGGSTGEPLEFYSNKYAGVIDAAHHWYLYSLMGYEKGDVIMGGGGHTIPEALRKKNIYWEKRDKHSVWGEIKFAVLHLSDNTIEYYIRKIIEIKPSILRGYPSFYDRLAQYILENDIKLNFTVKGINLTAEMCSASQRRNIEKAFSALVYFEYGHSEMCLYCYTSDATYVYKSSPIYGYIEVLDENDQAVAIGETGRVIATGFNNHGMPFIRYDTGDLGELLYKNEGAVHFKKVVGRNQDYILSSDSQKVYLTALIFGQHLRAFKNIIQWQIVQNVIGLVELRVIKGKGFSDDDECEIISNFKRVAKILVSFEYVENIPLTSRGKHLFLIQNIKLKRSS